MINFFLGHTDISVFWQESGSGPVCPHGQDRRYHDDAAGLTKDVLAAGPSVHHGNIHHPGRAPGPQLSGDYREQVRNLECHLSLLEICSSLHSLPDTLAEAERLGYSNSS